MESSKVYVNVMAEFTNDGRLLPRSFIWKDGHVYEIQKVTDVRRAASPNRRAAWADMGLCGYIRRSYFREQGICLY